MWNYEKYSEGNFLSAQKKIIFFRTVPLLFVYTAQSCKRRVKNLNLSPPLGENLEKPNKELGTLSQELFSYEEGYETMSNSLEIDLTGRSYFSVSQDFG